MTRGGRRQKGRLRYVNGEPIFEELVRHGRQDVAGVRRVWDQITRHHDPAAIMDAEQPPERPPAMTTVLEHVQSIQQHIEAFVASGKEKLEQDLPELAQFAQAAASNPLVDVALSAIHVDPALLSNLATLLADAEAKAAAAHQAAADAEAAQQAALDAAQPPAEPPAEAAA